MVKICKKRVGSARAGGSSMGETGRRGGGQGVSSDAAFASDSRSAQSGQVPRTDAAQTSSVLSIFFSSSVSCMGDASRRREGLRQIQG